MPEIPVFLLMGFLGSGKSTLLNRVFGDLAFGSTAVLIDELGEMALDHDLVGVGQTSASRVKTGCLCCTAGSDERSSLAELHSLALTGDVSFNRFIVETTGLGDPAPVINDLFVEPSSAEDKPGTTFRLEGGRHPGAYRYRRAHAGPSLRIDEAGGVRRLSRPDEG